jgi:peptidoglycan hydrolase-like protein with peptidoglycan-binding domain
VFNFRASLAFLFSAVLIASPAFGSRVHRAPTSGQSHKLHSPEPRAEHSSARKSARSTDSDASATRSTASGSTRKSSRRSGRKSSRDTVASSGHKAPRLHGQQSIDSERVTQIQAALIREHYLTGDATGQWDSTTEAAMQKYQADQGWQTKLMPDSRAIKKLGLGPDYSGAINAKNSTFADPPSASTIPSAQSSGFASAAGVSE